MTWEPLSDGRQLPLFRPAPGEGVVSVPEDKRAAAAQGMLHAWWAARIPDRLALVTAHGDRTYDDLNADINRLSRALRARGLGPATPSR